MAKPMTGESSPLAPFIDLDRGRARFALQPAPPTELDDVHSLLAGAAEVDITPPPGMPKAGYSSNAHDGAGFSTRLRARVLHLRAGRSSLAWVQCDLLGGSSVLQHLVAAAVAHHTDVPLAGVMIGATHTHAGPGQFLGTDFYNRFASNRGGFDPAYASFLVERIAGAVTDAVSTREPARLAVGSTEVWGLTRNRSLDPHVQNDTVTDRRLEPQRKFVAINPHLQLVRVDRRAAAGGYEPLAATVVFSVHGTGISHHARDYNADLWAFVVGELRHRIGERTGTRPVVGAVEGTHADVAPAIRPGLAGPLEARRVGRGVGAEAAALHERLEADLTGQVELAAGLRELDLTSDRSAGGVTLPNRPAVGAALVAGAHENLTPVIGRLPPFRAGTTKPFGGHGPQGEKWVLGSRWLQPLILPLRSFPRRIPVQVLRIGPVVVVGLPFEITVETGRRVQAAVDDVVRAAGVERTIVASVANEYCGYVATAEEYRRQFYEGGHTLYGPNTQRFLTAHAARLAGETVREGIVADVPAERSWDLKVQRFLARPTGARIERATVGPATFTDPTKVADGCWALEWVDVPPGDLVWHEPLVRVEAELDDGGWRLARSPEGLPADDQGWDVDVTHLGVAGDGPEAGHRYRTRWWDPSFRAGRRHRFVLLGAHGRRELPSEPFD